MAGGGRRRGAGGVVTWGAGGGGGGGDPIAGVPANIMRVKEAVIDEEELIKQRERESEGERLINQERCPHPNHHFSSFFLLPDMYLEAHYAVLL